MELRQTASHSSSVAQNQYTGQQLGKNTQAREVWFLQQIFDPAREK